MELLRQGPHAVGELAQHLPISQPAVSQHLKVLRRAGLVNSHTRAQQRIYEIAPEGLADLQTYLDGFWDGTLARLKAVAETPSEEPE